MADAIPPDLDSLATPVAWLGVETRLTHCNAAFARWLGVGQRRLPGFRLDELDVETGRSRLGACFPPGMPAFDESVEHDHQTCHRVCPPPAEQ